MGSAPIGRVRFSVPEDVNRLLEIGLREADLMELKALGVTPRESLIRGYEISAPCLTVTVDGLPAAMFGVSPDPNNPMAGFVWLLGTDDLMKVSRQFLRESVKWLDLLGERFHVLANAVHQDNTIHIRWLRWIGFSFLGRRGQFIEFARSQFIEFARSV